jgi:osmotically-inducible protein OsmY
MARFRSIAVLACVILLPLGLGGCAGALVAGGLAVAAGGGYAAGQERGVNGTLSDFELKTKIEQAMVKADARLLSGIETSVYEHRVLLTGRVASPELKSVAEQVAGSVPGVRALYDNLEVASPETAWNDARDAWITTRIRSEMLLDPGIRSLNYTIDTTNGSVYLIGSARSSAELDRATRIARYVPGVKRVVSYVELRSGAPLAALPAGTAAPAANAPAAPGTAPVAPVAVQKLSYLER